MSLASANGPSVTVFCLPFTSLPLRSKGWPWSLMWPLSPSPLSQFIHFCMTCCISAGDPSRDPPRYRNTNSLIFFLLDDLDFHPLDVWSPAQRTFFLIIQTMPYLVVNAGKPLPRRPPAHELPCRAILPNCRIRRRGSNL